MKKRRIRTRQSKVMEDGTGIGGVEGRTQAAHELGMHVQPIIEFLHEQEERKA